MNKDILEGNKLIAEFMGANFFTSPYGGEGYTFESTIIDMSKWKEIKDAKYHTSWDWIMPVVRKCYSIVNDGQNPDMEVQLSEALLSCDINELLLKVIQLIQWYNNQNK